MVCENVVAINTSPMYLTITLFGGTLTMPMNKKDDVKNLMNMFNELCKIPEAKAILIKYGAEVK